MATVSDGTNPGRSATPARQSPSRTRNGRAEGGDPTIERGQLPSEIFGVSQSYSTGAGGSRGVTTTPSTDVTEYEGQLEEGITGLKGAAITSTGVPGSTGAHPHAGGETVTVTDPFGYMGGENRSVTVQGQVDGTGDWTQFGDGNGFAGPTLPILANNRPTQTGAGSGHVSTHRKG